MGKVTSVILGLILISNNLVSQEYKSISWDYLRLIFYLDECCRNKQYTIVLPEDVEDIQKIMPVFKFIDSIHTIEQVVLPYSYYDTEFINYTIETHQPSYLTTSKMGIYTSFQSDSVYQDKMRFKGSKTNKMIEEGYHNLLYILSKLLKNDADLTNHGYLTSLQHYTIDFGEDQDDLNVEVLKSIDGFDPYESFYENGSDVKRQMFLHLKRQFKKDSSITQFFHKEKLVKSILRNPFLSYFGDANFSDSFKFDWVNKNIPSSVIYDSIATVYLERKNDDWYNKKSVRIYLVPGEKTKVERWYEDGEGENQFRITYVKPEQEKGINKYEFSSIIFGGQYSIIDQKFNSLNSLFPSSNYVKSYGVKFLANWSDYWVWENSYAYELRTSDLDSFGVNLKSHQLLLGLGLDIIPNSYINLSLIGNVGWSKRVLNIKDQKGGMVITPQFEAPSNFNSSSWSIVTAPKVNLTFEFPYFAFGGELGYRYDIYARQWSNSFEKRDLIRGLFINVFAGINLHYAD